jgi:hypothetical protein
MMSFDMASCMVKLASWCGCSLMSIDLVCYSVPGELQPASHNFPTKISECDRAGST